MIDTQESLSLYPALRGAPPPLLQEALSARTIITVPQNTQLFAEHQPCQGFPLVVSGSIRVVKTTPSGREMVLYRVETGGSCIITSSCLLGHADYSARGIAETELSLLLLPPRVFEALVAQHAPFRDFVFHLFSARLAELMQLVEEVAFSRLDQRLARLLLTKASPTVHTTHQRLAEELGSVREIVSRLLKGFAAQGLIEQGREQITLINRTGLTELAEGRR